MVFNLTLAFASQISGLLLRPAALARLIHAAAVSAARTVAFLLSARAPDYFFPPDPQVLFIFNPALLVAFVMLMLVLAILFALGIAAFAAPLVLVLIASALLLVLSLATRREPPGESVELDPCSVALAARAYCVFH